MAIKNLYRFDSFIMSYFYSKYDINEYILSKSLKPKINFYLWTKYKTQTYVT